MSVAAYLPSTQFAVMVSSVVVAGGLVVGAQYITRQPPTTLETATTSNPAEDWKAALDEVQASAGISLPEVPSQDTVDAILASTKSANLTDSLARSLFVSLTDAKTRGLGDDIPTQDELVAQAIAQTGGSLERVYSAADIDVVPQTSTSLREYGNTFMRVVADNPGANSGAVLLTVAYAVDYNNADTLAELSSTEEAYTQLARALAATKTPETLLPLHLQVTNNVASMARAIHDIRSMGGDPVRGLAGVQTFYALSNETFRVLTTIAGTFSKNGILFSKDEPGHAWSAFISLQQ